MAVEISNIRSLEVLKADKAMLRTQIRSKEAELELDFERAKTRYRMVASPINILKSVIGFFLSQGVYGKGRSVAYKLGYALATKLFNRKK